MAGEHSKWREQFDRYFAVMPDISASMPLEQALWIACDLIPAQNIDRAVQVLAEEVWKLQEQAKINPMTQAIFDGKLKPRFGLDLFRGPSLQMSLWLACDIVPMSAIDCAAKVLAKKIWELQGQLGIVKTKPKLEM